MKYTLGEIKNNQITVSFELNKKEWEEEVEKAYQKHKGEYKKEGFRQGRVPRKVLEQTYGEFMFYEDAFNDCFPEYYTQMLKKEKQLFPVDYPQIDLQQMDTNGVKFTATVTLLPEVQLGDYKNIKVEKKAVKVTEAEVKKELEGLREKQVRFVEVENREAKNGDLVNIDYSGSVDGVKFDGGTASDQELELGSNTFIAGFEDQVCGMKIGETRDINVTFPEHYHSKELENKPAVFTVKLLGIREKVLPELNDEFASNVSEFETLADLKKDLKAKLLEHKEKHAAMDLENELVGQIVKNATVEIPQAMVESQIDREVEDLTQRLAYQGLRLEDYLQYMGTTIEQFRKSRQDAAREQVKTSLVMEEIIKVENVKVLQKDIKEKISQIAEATKRNVTDVEREMKEGQEEFLKNTILSEKVIKLLKELNNIK